MRSLSFDPQILRKHLLRHKIATLPELKQALGTNAGLTVFRKLKLLDYLSSYTHRGRYYSLREIARFDDAGLWSHEAVWFSRYGTLVSTIESFVHHAPGEPHRLSQTQTSRLPIQLHPSRPLLFAS